MTRGAPPKTSETPWRIEKRYGVSVYSGREPVADFRRAEDAALAVAAVNVAPSAVLPAHVIDVLQRAESVCELVGHRGGYILTALTQSEVDELCGVAADCRGIIGEHEVT
jgi:hypothetical protein